MSCKNPGGRFGYSGAGDHAEDELRRQLRHLGSQQPRSQHTLSARLATDHVDLFFRATFRDGNQERRPRRHAGRRHEPRLPARTTRSARRVNLPPSHHDGRPRGPSIQVLEPEPAPRRFATRSTSADRPATSSKSKHRCPSLQNPRTQVGGWPTLPAGTSSADTNHDGVHNLVCPVAGFRYHAADQQRRRRERLHVPGKLSASPYTPHAFPPRPKPSRLRSRPLSVMAPMRSFPKTAASRPPAQATAAVRRSTWPGAAWAARSIKCWSSDSTSRGSTRARFPMPVSRSPPRATSSEPTSSNFSGSTLVHRAPTGASSRSIFKNAPGVAFDGNSATLGLDANSRTLPHILTLGTLAVSNVAAGENIVFERRQPGRLPQYLLTRFRRRRRSRRHDPARTDRIPARPPASTPARAIPELAPTPLTLRRPNCRSSPEPAAVGLPPAIGLAALRAPELKARSKLCRRLLSRRRP